ncbi:response regulator [Pseudogracilibacillus auburnensis]|uniref:Two-component system response regulator YcbB n=1 Tax=Pseudogracilibacillus auburnensis TaxID=1494959 RepID=A0A2V3W1X2_9BACI|nr:response regulator [Pseudogracilibacillus auburnensis]MBO1002796.1 response regulator [Pseudogracilibacillus auburnensis]PXW87910.1 two-component system response regulator YcbB [Pseudogracilibacillus auburnensis]
MVGFGIIDDDPVCRRMLESIIEENNLGKILTSSPGGDDAMEDIMETNPQVVLIDLLMPGMDGITIIMELQKAGYGGNFIMISQIDNKEMVAEAYKNGIEFFIHKPINRAEVTAVIENVKAKLKLNQSLYTIKKSLSQLEITPASVLKETDPLTDSSDRIVQHILMSIGLIGERGSNDILTAMEILIDKNYSINNFPPLKELYEKIAIHYNRFIDEEELKREIRAIEQRIRRSVMLALTNLASIGLTDYTNPKFEHYASLLFDFQDVRLKMNELKNEDSKVSGVKINVKKFLQVIYVETLDKLHAGE